MEGFVKINTLIFDMGGVIFENGTKNVIAKLTQEYGFAKHHAEETFLGPDSWALRAGEITSEIYWQSIYERFKHVINMKDVDLQLLWYNEFKLRTEMKPLLSTLSHKYRIGIISGNIKDRVDFLITKYDLGQYFSFQAYSYQYGIHKNNPLFYEKVIQDQNIDPKTSLFIDDNEDCLIAAERNELKTILFHNVESLKRELHGYEISTASC